MIVDFLLTSVITESIEQKYCIKFCQKLGNNQTKIIQKIQQAFGNEALIQTQRNGLIASKAIKCQWRVRHALAGHAQAEMRR